MGILAPLFLAGLAGLALPLVFHLVRRAPRGRHDFSSLLFLAPTPPRLTRRSRLDQVLLLLLRLAALALLAIAFARPFVREASLLTLTDLPRRRVAILVDGGASMRRSDLWDQMRSQLRKEIDELAPHDDVALFTGSDRLATVVGFDSHSNATHVSSRDIVRRQIDDLQPTWAASDLGTSLAALAGELDASNDVRQSLAEPRIVVISDFTRGDKLDALQSFTWPERVRVVLRPLAPRRSTNASLQLLTGEEASNEGEPRVRIVNADNSAHDQFFIRWSSAKGADARLPAERAADANAGEIAVYVPPGQSRVARLPRPTNNPFADRIVLRGDDHEFDNTYYVAPPRRQKVRLAYAGDDAADDPQGWQYYVRLATSDDPLREVEIVKLDADASLLGEPSPPRIAIVAKQVADQVSAALTSFVEQGGTLVLVAADLSAAESHWKLFDDVAPGDERAPRKESDFVLLGQIDFAHPLFSPLAHPRYNDFTRIHFWRHRPARLRDDAKTRVIARFDNEDPWILERHLGRGRLLGFTSGWNPDDSQLAVSSKFVPLVGGLIDAACGTSKPLDGVLVNESVTLPIGRRETLVVKRPDGQETPVAAETAEYLETNMPGLYSIAAESQELRFAVNVAARESDTGPLDLDRLDQLGVRRGDAATRSEQLARLRQERDTELESRQQVWRWLLVGCLGLLICETLWAGRAARIPASLEAVP